MSTSLQVEKAVKDRYSIAAQQRVEELCCPVQYDPKFLKAIPQEVLDRDYGCGDPSQFLRPGETVLDLGSGAGKICFIASQVVGPKGKVIGVDMNDDMLGLARSAQTQVSAAVGWGNVEFKKGRIQDLALDLDLLDRRLRSQPSTGVNAYLAAEALAEELRLTSPMIAPDSMDVVVSNCVLNLVKPRDKRLLFDELYRVLKSGGRAVISDIVSDEEVPQSLMDDPELWSGCISGALTEIGFLQAFEEAGFHGIELVKRDAAPWRTVQGIEFRSVTVRAFKGAQGPCVDCNQAVIYKGPFKEVVDDDGNRFERGLRYAVCEKTFRLLQGAPYSDAFEFISPRIPVAPEDGQPFDCTGMRLRHPKETKGLDYDSTTEGSSCCDPGSSGSGGQCCC